MSQRRLQVPLLAALLLTAPPARAAQPPRTPALLEQGRVSYARSCAACHGPKGEGDGAAAKALHPAPRNLVTEGPPGGAAEIFEVLGTGVKGTGMIAFKHLSEQERWALAYFVEGMAAPRAR